MQILLCSSRIQLLKRWQEIFDHIALEATSVKELLKLCQQSKGALILLDPTLAEDDLNDLLKEVLYYPLCKIFILTGSPHTQEGLSLLKQKVHGYGNAYMSKENLLTALDVIRSGNIWLYPDLVQHLIQSTALKSDTDVTLDILTPKEKETALLVAKGHSNKEIASLMENSERTVKAHLSAIYAKLDIHDRLSLALLIKGQHDD